MSLQPERTFYEQVGGHETFVRLVDVFYDGVAADPVLGTGWSPSSLTLMRQGQPPRISRAAGAVGGGSNATIQLNHIQALEHGGGVYDLDNIEIVTPRMHGLLGQ